MPFQNQTTVRRRPQRCRQTQKQGPGHNISVVFTTECGLGGRVCHVTGTGVKSAPYFLHTCLAAHPRTADTRVTVEAEGSVQSALRSPGCRVWEVIHHPVEHPVTNPASASRTVYIIHCSVKDSIQYYNSRCWYPLVHLGFLCTCQCSLQLQ